MDDKLKENLNLKCLSDVLVHYRTQEQLQRSSSFIVQVSTGGMNITLPKDIPSFGVLMMVVESAV